MVPQWARERSRRHGRQLLDALPLNTDATIEAARQLEASIRPDFRRAVIAGVGAIVALATGLALGNGVYTPQLQRRLIIIGLTVAFVVLAVLAIRSAGNEVARVIRARGAPAAGGTVRLLISLVGYTIVIIAMLAMLAVPLGKILVGGAITGVVVGIAAQQSLGNVFAGLLILLARPFRIGDDIRVRSGSMGGPIDGIVVAMGLIYTTLDTDDGIVQLPNLGLLSAAVGPRPRADGTPPVADPVASAPPGLSGPPG